MKHTLLFLIAVASFATAAKSELVLNNIANNSGDIVMGFDFWKAQSFETTAGTWTLDNVVLRLKESGGSIITSIYSDSGSNLPGSSIQTLSGPTSVGASYENLTYSGTSLTLTGNTRYWIVVRDTAFGLTWSTAPDDTKSGAWSIPGVNPSARSGNAGSSWVSDTNIYNFSINATAAAAVPEPGTWAGAVLLAGGGAFARWRRRRAGQ